MAKSSNNTGFTHNMSCTALNDVIEVFQIGRRYINLLKSDMQEDKNICEDVVRENNYIMEKEADIYIYIYN